MLGIRIAEGDMDARQFFVLQNMTDNILYGDVGTDGEFTHAVAVFIG